MLIKFKYNINTFPIMSEDALRNTIEIQAEVLKERNELVESLIKT